MYFPFLMRNLFFFFFPLLFFAISSYAQQPQIIISPITTDPSRGISLEQTKSFRTNTSTTALDITDTILNLPFFDDFAESNINPNPIKWKRNGGTYINDNYGINPPSYNVATFDGIDYKGNAYNRTTSSAIKGKADELTSSFIDLSSYLPSDSVYLSFFWQAGGLGDLPEPIESDHFSLEFKDSSGKWQEVWSIEKDSSAFTETLIPILDQKYFFNNFQFRFLSYGLLSGSYDVWNLDYILLDKGRSKADTNYFDLAIVNKPSSLLKHYYAMPYKQFFPFIAKETNTSVQFDVFNHSNSPNPMLMNNPDSLPNHLIDEYTGTVLDSFGISVISSSKTYNTATWAPDYSKLASFDKPLYLKYIFTPGVTDDTVLFGANNSVSNQVILDNYYAYDDGTAEFAFATNDDKAEVAVNYSLNTPDSLIGVYIDFLPIQNNLEGKTFEIKAWKSVNLGHGDESVIVSQKVKLKYAENGVLPAFYFDTPVPISGDFFIGFAQLIKDYVFVGLDFNTDNSSKIFFKFQNIWNAYQGQYFPASFLIRPIFGGNNYIPAPPILAVTPKTEKEFSVTIFPNPSTGTFQIKGAVNKIVVYNLSGLVVKELSFQEEDSAKSFNLDDQPSGLYIARFSGSNGLDVKRISLIK